MSSLELPRAALAGSLLPIRSSAEEPAADAVLVANPGDLAIGKIDLEHVFRRADHADRGVAAGVEDFGRVGAVLARRDITIAAVDVEGQPVRPAAAAQAQLVLQNRGHRIAHVPD